MFLFPNASINGAKRGLLLWFNTVLPTLLPFIIVSSLLVKLGIASSLCRFLYPLVGKVFRVSKNACYAVVMGFLSGIPMGAKTSCDLIKNKEISIQEGQFLATMCNNASTMFIMGYIGMNELKLPKMSLHLVFILYGSAIITALIFRSFYERFTHETYSIQIPKFNTTTNLLHAQSIPQTKKKQRFKIDFTIVDECIMDGFEVITKVGGYIILFSILAQIILSMNQLNHYVRMLIVGICEITTGIDTIANSALQMDTKIVLILALTSFGGLSGLAQTKSVFADSGLSIISYLKAKIMNAFITFLLGLLYVKFLL